MEQGAWSLEKEVFQPPITLIDTDKDKEAGQRLGKPSGASELELLPSELADSPVSESLSRAASGPAGQRCRRELMNENE